MRKKSLPKGLRWRDGVIHMTFMAHGKQVQRSTHTTDIARAEFLLREAQNAVFDGTYVPQKATTKLTVQELMDLWLANPKPKAQCSIEADRQRFKVLVELLGANTPIHTLTLRHCEELQRQLKQRKVGKYKQKPTSPTTVNRFLVLMKSALRYATKQGYAHQNPMDGINLDPEHPKKRYVSPEQFSAMLSHPSVTPEVRVLLQVGYYTGMRLRSALELTWDRVNFNKKFIMLRPEDNKTKQTIEIPLADELATVLKAYRDAQPVVELHGRLFNREKTQVSKDIVKVAKSLGFDGVSFHAFRGAMITNLLESGVDVISVASITGHKSMQTISGYARIGLQAKHEALRKLKRNSN